MNPIQDQADIVQSQDWVFGIVVGLLAVLVVVVVAAAALAASFRELRYVSGLEGL